MCSATKQRSLNFQLFRYRITVTDTDQKTVVSIPKDVQDSISSTVRPFKRNATSQQRSKEFESLPTPPAENTTDGSKKFWPPSPKLRSATSMVNLTDLDVLEPNNNSVEQRSKKPKWYNKLSHTLKLTPQNLKLSGSESNLSKEPKTKSKKNIWRRMKIAS